MGIKYNGFYYDIGTIWNTCSNDNSIRILHLETKQVHTGNPDDRTRPRLQEVGRYYY